jgi:hypothetical protein
VGNTGVKLRVRYKDNSNGSFTVAAFGRTFTGQKNNTGGWRLAEFATNVSANAQRIEIRAVGNDLVLHMVEVLRGKSGEVRVSRAVSGTSPVSGSGSVVYVFDMRGRLLMRLDGVIESIGSARRIQETCGAGCYLTKIIMNGNGRPPISRLIIEE